MRIRRRTRKVTLVLALALALALVLPSAMAFAAPVPLGTTASFAVLAGETITNTGPTTITGDVGLHPGSAWNLVGVTLSGAEHLADAVALGAKNDLIAAFDNAALRTPTIIGTELAGQVLQAGVYASNSGTFEIAAGGTLTLDAAGDPDAVFVFQAATTLVTFSNSTVSVINQGRFCRVFWKVDSATLGTDSVFRGHLFALTSIQAQTRATIEGQLLARNGSVTLDSNTITNGLCPTLATTTTAPGSVTTVHGEYPRTGGGTPWYFIVLPLGALALLVLGGVVINTRKVTR